MFRNVQEKINNTSILGRDLSDKKQRAFLTGSFSMSWNILYGLFHGVIAIQQRSMWYGVLFVYYIVLGLMRLSVTSLEYKSNSRNDSRVMRNLGIAFLFLACLISGIVYLDFRSGGARTNGLIVMIVIATFTFSVFTMAVINTIKAHRTKSAFMISLRNISLASAIVSMLSLERSMLRTFGEDGDIFTYTMKGWTGLGVFLIIVLIGITMIVHGKMPKHQSGYNRL